MGDENIIFFNPAYLIVSLVLFLVCVGAIIDAARFPGAAYQGTGFGKTGWLVLLVIFTLFCNLLALVMVVVWFFAKKPKVTNHVRFYGYGRQHVAPGPYPGQPGYGGYGSAPPGSQFGGYGPGQGPASLPPRDVPRDAPRDSPGGWAPPPPPPS